MRIPFFRTLRAAGLSVLTAAAPAQSPTQQPNLTAGFDHSGPCTCGVQGGHHHTATELDFNPQSFLWPTTASGDPSGLGRPMRLTWAFALDGSPIPAQPTLGLNTNAASSLNSVFPGDPGGLQMEIASYIAEWAANCGVSLTQVTSDPGTTLGPSGPPGTGTTVADIRIGAAPLAGNIVGFAFFPAFGGDIVLDSSDPQLQSNLALLRNTVRHELGHALGLGHVCPENGSKIMESIVQQGFATPFSQDELLGAHMIYGDPFEVRFIDSSGAMILDDTPLGFGFIHRFQSMAVGAPVVRTGHSIDPGSGGAAGTDVDFFGLTAQTSGIVRVTVTPVGANYSVSSQPATGCVGAGVPQFPVSTGDLSVSVTGVATPTMVNATSFGGSEVLEFAVTTADLAQIAVTAFTGPVGGGTSPYPQQYTITAELFPTPGACQTGNVVTGTGASEDTVFLNGSAGGLPRTAIVPINNAFTLSVMRPSQNPAPAGFVLWIDTTIPLGTPFSFGAPGTACFDPFSSPASALLVDTFGVFGTPLIGGVASANPTTSIAIPGIPSALSLVVQGAIEQTPGVPRITNGVILRVR